LRYGVISDIHGNLHALEAALSALSRAGVDEYLCAGDLVGYGPMPNECVARLADLEARCVGGNHDLIALDRLSDAGCSELTRSSLEWTREELSSDSRGYLENLPTVLVTADGVVVAHGSLEAPSAYVREAHQRRAQLRLLEQSYPQAHLLVLGHTHRQVAYGEHRGSVRSRPGGSLTLAGPESYALNPGSVGQARERTARARFMVLDLEQRRVSFHAIRYDVGGCRRALRERELPTWSAHLKPSPLRDRARALRGALNALSIKEGPRPGGGSD
jgi:putative phosphoesterase